MATHFLYTQTEVIPLFSTLTGSMLFISSIQIFSTRTNSAGTSPGTMVSTAADICASLQYATLLHMAKRLYRCFMFCDSKQLLPETNRKLVSKLASLDNPQGCMRFRVCSEVRISAYPSLSIKSPARVVMDQQ